MGTVTKANTEQNELVYIGSLSSQWRKVESEVWFKINESNLVWNTPVFSDTLFTDHKMQNHKNRLVSKGRVDWLYPPVCYTSTESKAKETASMSLQNG